MRLYLLRHGCAQPQASKDSERALTLAGRDEVQRVMETVVEELSPLTHVYTSPYVRARQTAQIAIAAIRSAGGEPPEPEITEQITPGGNPQGVLDFLFQRFNETHSQVLLVTHQPFVGTLLDDACGFEPGQYRMKTGTLAAVDFKGVVAKGLGALAWLKQP